jgi:subtilisin family serine protease
MIYNLYQYFNIDNRARWSMTEEERYKITSNEYADLIIDYRRNPLILSQIPNASVHIINHTFAVLYFPIESLNRRSMEVLEYLVDPYVCGLTSEEALEASGVDEIRGYPNLNLRGEGTLVGIIDTGINYRLPVFVKEDGTTKIHSIWDQTIQSDHYPFETFFGTEYTADQINQALAAENPLDIVPSDDENGHGTMLAAIAAGREIEQDNFYGVAPDAELIIVKLMQAKEYLREIIGIPEGVACYQENAIMWGVDYCIRAARRARRPLAICLGLGTSQGPHDGYSPLSIFTSLSASLPGVGIVTPVGNEGNLSRHHFSSIGPGEGSVVVEMNVGERDKNFTMELWGDNPGIFSMDILSPSGEYIPRITASLRLDRRISFLFESTVIETVFRTVESGTGDQVIALRFRNASPGTWRFTIYSKSDLQSSFHMWLPMDDFISHDTYFVQSDIYTTVLSPGSATVPITVTAYNPRTGTLYANSSRGYTRLNKVKPELAAPGVNYIAPALDGSYRSFSGTSVASAHTAGIVALLLEYGVVRGNIPNLSTTPIKNYLIRGANRSGTMVFPNRDWGFGSIDIFNMFRTFRANV